ncbi:MAG: hypothetical protein HYU28_00300 [Actinobacteria bacterium]|nr:hypothetical protein [Actinomycetota bacterium]
MGTRQTTFGKLERERAKRAKAAAKRAQRQRRSDEPEVDEDEPEAPTESAEVLIGRLARLHEQYDAGEISFVDFDARKAELSDQIARLPMEGGG